MMDGLTSTALYKPAGVALLIMCIKTQTDAWLAASLDTIAEHPGAMNSNAMRTLINAELQHRALALTTQRVQ